MANQDFMSGFWRGLAGPLSQAILTRSEMEYRKRQEETEMLHRFALDPAASQAQRDAALYALVEFGKKSKPGSGVQAFYKKFRELDPTAQVPGEGAGKGITGGVPEIASLSGIGARGGPPGAEEAQTPAAQQVSAALPATSPTQAGAAPMGPPLPPEGDRLALPARPTPEQLTSFGAGMGMREPEKPVPPVKPNVYTARKIDIDTYKADLTEYKSAEQRYADHFERLATLYHQERRQEQDQAFRNVEREEDRAARKEEREAEHGFQREERAKERGKDIQIAGMRETQEGKKRTAAQKTYFTELRTLTAGTGRKKFEPGYISPEEFERRKQDAANRYTAMTGEEPPEVASPPPRAATKPVGGPPGPPATELDKRFISILETRRRALPKTQFCAELAAAPSVPPEQKQLAMRKYGCT